MTQGSVTETPVWIRVLPGQSFAIGGENYQAGAEIPVRAADAQYLSTSRQWAEVIPTPANPLPGRHD